MTRTVTTSRISGLVLQSGVASLGIKVIHDYAPSR